MRRLITGTDGAGRSCVVGEDEVTFGAAPERGGVSYGLLYMSAELPPPLSPAGSAEHLDLGVARGLGWMIIRWEPGFEWPMHHTDTVDLDLVLEGSIELLLDDGAHRLGPGDSVLVTGVDHAWRSGPHGCTVAIVGIGVPRDA